MYQCVERCPDPTTDSKEWEANHLKLKGLAAAAAIIVSSALSVSAASFDFADMATDFKVAANDGINKTLDPGQEGTFAQLQTFDASRFTSMGVTITNITAPGTQHPFFDGRDGSGPAGLGVCSSGFNGSLSQCSSSGGSKPGDDNLVFTEQVTITLDRMVKLTGLQIRRGNHSLINNVLSAIQIDDGAGFDTYGTGANGWVNLAGLGAASSFTFTSVQNQIPEIYLSVLEVQPVPLPAGALLLLTGFGGLAAMKRRRKS